MGSEHSRKDPTNSLLLAIQKIYILAHDNMDIKISFKILRMPFQGPDSKRHSISDRTVNTGVLLIAQIHGYLLGLKSIKTLIVGLQKI
jgi:hypothetical protein